MSILDNLEEISNERSKLKRSWMRHFQIFCFFGLGASLIDQLVKGGDEFCCVAIETVITAMLNFEGGQLGLGREEIKVL